MSNPLTSFISSFMTPSSENEAQAIEHLSTLQAGAQWRLDDDAVSHRPKGYHQRAVYTNPEGAPEVPRQYIVTSHSHERDFETYAANSYSSAIAIQEGMKKRGF
ncbi:hypothetical protein ATCC90586_010072 [Pythium insidiosum]|nr:hypothetical protein ATCC90586_010072 [Pythium insidiosum]